MKERGNAIVLIGFMGAGKSSVGRTLARMTGLPRFDTDEMVAARFALTIPEIFEKHGQEKFRDAETEALTKLRNRGQAIIVTGGGIVLREENVTLLRELGRRADGQWISMSALVAIQWTHRLFAIVVVVAMGWLVARLWRRGPDARRRGLLIAALVVLQLATGLSNVVLGWPMSAALAHTAGAAALVVCLGREAAVAMQSRYRSSLT